MPSGIVLAQAVLQVGTVAQAANTTITVSPGLDPGDFLGHGGEVGGIGLGAFLVVAAARNNEGAQHGKAERAHRARQSGHAGGKWVVKVAVRVPRRRRVSRE